jgi:hypothetical protein
MTLHPINSSTQVQTRLTDHGRWWLAFLAPKLATEVSENGDFRCTLDTFVRIWGAPDDPCARMSRVGPLHIVLDA